MTKSGPIGQISCYTKIVLCEDNGTIHFIGMPRHTNFF